MTGYEAGAPMLLDAAIRFSAFGILILLACLLARDAGRTWAGRLSAAFMATAAAYLLCSSAYVRAAAGEALPLLVAVCLAGPAILWLGALAIFQENFRPRLWHGGVILAIEFFGLASLGTVDLGRASGELFTLAHRLLVVALYGHALWIAWHGRRDDLVEARREFRRLFVGSVAIYGTIVAFVEGWLGRGGASAGIETLAAFSVLALTFTLTVFALRIEPGRLFEAAPTPARPKTGDPFAAPSLGPADRQLLAALRNAVERDRVYLEEGLTIARLAEKLRAPEHHLRRVINEGLGHRHFNAFLNHYRVELVKTWLADLDKARVPILTLALDAGYGSLAPFNRAFKETVGMPPSTYRKLKLGDLAEPPIERSPE